RGPRRIYRGLYARPAHPCGGDRRRADGDTDATGRLPRGGCALRVTGVGLRRGSRGYAMPDRNSPIAPCTRQIFAPHEAFGGTAVPRTEQDERALTEALRALAANEAGLGCSPAVEARLTAEVRSIATARRRVGYVAAVLAAAAVWLLVAARPMRRVPPETRAGEVTTEF